MDSRFPLMRVAFTTVEQAENECPVKYEAIKTEYQELHGKIADLLTIQVPHLQGAMDSTEATVDTLKATITDFIEWVEMERDSLEHLPDDIAASSKEEEELKRRPFGSKPKDVPVKPLTWQESLGML